MIKNEKQYQVTRKQLGEFKKALEILENEENIFPTLKEIQLASLKSQIGTFEEELLEYENLKDGKCDSIFIASLNGIQEGLIKARISCGYTQAQLAELLSLKEQQIQRYESTNYESASIGKILEIVDVLGVESSTFRLRRKQNHSQHFLQSTDINSADIQKATCILRGRRTLLELN